MNEYLLWLEQLPFIALIRNSQILYPATLTGHLVGLALTYGSALVTSVQLVGRSAPTARKLRLSVRLSVIGFALAAATGVILFAVDANDYAANDAMRTKLALIALAGINALAFAIALRARGDASDLPAPFRRAAGIVAIFLWTAVIAAGRWIAY